MKKRCDFNSKNCSFGASCPGTTAIISMLLIVQMDPGLPPPAPVSSHTFVGRVVVGTHHFSGMHRTNVTSGGSSLFGRNEGMIEIVGRVR